jgi:hypothetical protein
LFSVVSLIYNEHLRRHPLRLGHRPDYQKAEAGFSDAIAAVRQLFWEQTLLAQPRLRKAVQQITPAFKQFLLDALCEAA